MKKMLAIALVLAAGTASAAVSSTKHNMNSYSGSQTQGGTTANATGGTGDVCYYCHAAHNTLVGAAPLWARNNPVTTSYVTYSSSTISKNINGIMDPVSLACLSCHDGTIAVNQTIKGRVGGLATDKFMLGNATAKIGPNLSNDHPVSIAWAGTGYAGLTATMPAAFQPYNIGGSPGLACASCHEPHGTAFSKFLRADPNSGSFCVSCHASK